MTRTVTFPGLGLEFTMSPVAFTVFGWPIHWYGVIIACGFLLAVWYGVGRAAPRFGVDQDKITDMLFFAVPLALIGARAYYVIFTPELYWHDGRFDWGEAVAVWDGGLAIYGGIIAAVLTALVYTRVRKQSFWDYADTGAFGLLIGQAVGRWGNFVNVEAFGSVTGLPWRMAGPDVAAFLYRTGQADEALYRQIVEGTLGVHPTFFYESLWNVIGFTLLALLSRRGRRFSGQWFLSYIVWYGVGRTVIEGLRTDSLYFFSTPLRTSQLVGLASAIAGIALFAVRWRTAPPATPPLPPKAGGDGGDDGDDENDGDGEDGHQAD